jgi:hypothetical protein
MPDPLVRVVELTFVAVFVNSIWVLGMTAPLGSRTVPPTVPVLACGQADAAIATAAITTRIALRIYFVPSYALR